MKTTVNVLTIITAVLAVILILFIEMIFSKVAVIEPNYISNQNICENVSDKDVKYTIERSFINNSNMPQISSFFITEKDGEITVCKELI